MPIKVWVVGLLVLVGILCWWAAAFAYHTPTFSGKVLRVIDGDTLKVAYGTDAVVVRLYGVDAPETRQRYGWSARAFVHRLVAGHTVTVMSHGHDRYGRLIGSIYLGTGANLGQALVEHGLAWWYTSYAPKDVLLAQLEYEARLHTRGLWAARAPVAPWVWRAAH